MVVVILRKIRNLRVHAGLTGIPDSFNLRLQRRLLLTGAQIPEGLDKAQRLHAARVRHIRLCMIADASQIIYVGQSALLRQADGIDRLQLQLFPQLLQHNRAGSVQIVGGGNRLVRTAGQNIAVQL